MLPDLVTDDQHAAAVDMLSELLRKDNQFTAPVLDSLGSLQLNPAMLKQVNDTVTESVASANPQDLPMVIRFLLQHMTAGQHAKSVVVGMPPLAAPAGRGLLSSTASCLGCPTNTPEERLSRADPSGSMWLISSLATTRRMRRPRTSSARCAAGWGSTCSSRTATRRPGPASPAARRWCSTPSSRRCGCASVPYIEGSQVVWHPIDVNLKVAGGWSAKTGDALTLEKNPRR